MESPSDHVAAVLRLTLVKGFGPVLISRAIGHLGSAEAVLSARPSQLEPVKGFGPGRAAALAKGVREVEGIVKEELARASDHGVKLLAIGDAGYPGLLARIHDPPPLLYVRGELRPDDLDVYTLAIVGSRSCTPYGSEQAARFASFLASHSITIVSGGALVIDSAAHRAALRAPGRTIAVLGCGLSGSYPPANTELFASIADGNGAVISELPMATPPAAENFPARNRIISGLSLGVLVIEAGLGSGSLITARLAGDDHNREVFAVPGRVDSPASEGTLQLIKAGAAQVVTTPADVLESLETPARHLHNRTHDARYPVSPTPVREDGGLLDSLGDGGREGEQGSGFRAASEKSGSASLLSDSQRRIVAAATTPKTADELIRETGLEAPALRADLTILELQRKIERVGPAFRARR